jgi:chorismate synthase
MMEYCILEDIASIEQAVDLEIQVWNLDPRDAIASYVMRAMILNGAFLVGAYDGDQMIGVAFAFPVRRPEGWALWSYIAGVRRDYQDRGVGFGLKQTQRNWALSQGYDRILWTFDPLQRGNANFNMRRLGATASVYHVNFYGEMTDGLNKGLPSDRLQVTWLLRDPRVESLAGGAPAAPLVENYPETAFLLTAGVNHQPCLRELSADLPTWSFAEIPPNLSSLKDTSPTLALEWRLALRSAMQTALSYGYAVVDFVTNEQRCFYIFRSA